MEYAAASSQMFAVLVVLCLEKELSPCQCRMIKYLSDIGWYINPLCFRQRKMPRRMSHSCTVRSTPKSGPVTWPTYNIIGQHIIYNQQIDFTVKCKTVVGRVVRYFLSKNNIVHRLKSQSTIGCQYWVFCHSVIWWEKISLRVRYATNNNNNNIIMLNNSML